MGKYADMFFAAQKAKALKALSPIYVEFKRAGDHVVGQYMGRSEVESSMGTGTYYQYLFDTDIGPVKCALGQATDKEVGLVMEPGKVYAVVFKGKEKISGGRSVNKFDVNEIDLENPQTEEEKPPPKTRKRAGKGVDFKKKGKEGDVPF